MAVATREVVMRLLCWREEMRVALVVPWERQAIFERLMEDVRSWGLRGWD
jgi:hypothetical protein